MEVLEVSQLNTLESDVLDVIPSGSEHKIAIREISNLVNVDDRSVYEVINSLRKKGVPVCAKRSGDNGGYFIAETEEERREGLAAYKAQVKDMTKLIDHIESADLEGWRQSLKSI